MVEPLWADRSREDLERPPATATRELAVIHDAHGSLRVGLYGSPVNEPLVSDLCQELVGSTGARRTVVDRVQSYRPGLRIAKTTRQLQSSHHLVFWERTTAPCRGHAALCAFVMALVAFFS